MLQRELQVDLSKIQILGQGRPKCKLVQDAAVFPMLPQLGTSALWSLLFPLQADYTVTSEGNPSLGSPWCLCPNCADKIMCWDLLRNNCLSHFVASPAPPPSTSPLALPAARSSAGLGDLPHGALSQAGTSSYQKPPVPILGCLAWPRASAYLYKCCKANQLLLQP